MWDCRTIDPRGVKHGEYPCHRSLDETFECAQCDWECCYCFGSDDEHFTLCDDCTAAAEEKMKSLIPKIKFTKSLELLFEYAEGYKLGVMLLCQNDNRPTQIVLLEDKMDADQLRVGSEEISATVCLDVNEARAAISLLQTAVERACKEDGDGS